MLADYGETSVIWPFFETKGEVFRLWISAIWAWSPTVSPTRPVR
ncbi:hypothetical protein [Streptomyces sp. NBC_01718]